MNFEYLMTGDDIIIKGDDIFEVGKVVFVSDFWNMLLLDNGLLFYQDTGERFKISKLQEDFQLNGITELRLSKIKQKQIIRISFTQKIVDFLTMVLFIGLI